MTKAPTPPSASKAAAKSKKLARKQEWNTRTANALRDNLRRRKKQANAGDEKDK